MSGKFNKMIYPFIALFWALNFIFFLLVGGGVGITYAAAVSSAEFDKSYVLDDLNGAQIEGNTFSYSDYGFDSGKTTQILTFVEYCYSYYSNMQDNYSLYVYVYNPQCVDYDWDSTLNKIQFSYGDESNYAKYSLKFLNYSVDGGTYGLFAKYRVVLPDTVKNEILETLNPDGRIYTVSGIELLVNGDMNATDYAASGGTADNIVYAKEYTYTGYADGYGSIDGDSAELSCTVKETDVLSLDITQTVYRPEGNYYNGTQSQLNSCFFSVPNKYFEAFGNLTDILCEWWKYDTGPIYVTADEQLYQGIYDLHGVDSFKYIDDFTFLILILGNVDHGSFVWDLYPYYYSTNYANKLGSYTWASSSALVNTINFANCSPLDYYCAVFYTNGESLKDYSVSPAEIQEQFLLNSSLSGKDLDINGKYSSYFFSGDTFFDFGYERKELSVNDNYELWWTETVKSTFYQKLFGGYDVNIEYETVNGMQTVTQSDLRGSDSLVAQRLYMDVNDVPALREVVNEADDEETVVLLRYDISTYYSVHCTEAVRSLTTDDWTLVQACYDAAMNGNFTSYVAQETVYLDFDIIQLTFTAENGEKTVVPVVSSPVDVFSPITPPLEESYGDDGFDWLAFIFLVIGIILLLAILKVLTPIIAPFIAPVLDIVKSIVTAPFRLIKKIFTKKE